MQRQGSGVMSRRREMDFMKMASSPQYQVTPTDSVSEFFVILRGPDGTPYEKGVWNIRIGLPDEYPFKSPSIGFANRIFHPNVDERSGSVCLDVINQTWTPMYALSNIIDTFLPQLLRYPNATDPLNPEAAALMLNDPTSYVSKVQDHVNRFATKAEADRAVLRFVDGNATATRADESPQTDASRGLSASNTPPSVEEHQPTGEIVVADDEDSEYEPDEIEL